MSNVVGTLSEPEFDLFQVCTELDNHYSMNDKDLAEFIIDLAQKHADLEVRTTSIYIFRLFWTFRKKLKAKKTQAKKNSSKLFKNSIIYQLKTDFLLKKVLKLIYFARKFAET